MVLQPQQAVEVAVGVAVGEVVGQHSLRSSPPISMERLIAVIPDPTVEEQQACSTVFGLSIRGLPRLSLIRLLRTNQNLQSVLEFKVSS